MSFNAIQCGVNNSGPYWKLTFGKLSVDFIKNSFFFFING